jgi:hypothetical protein
MIQLCLVNDVGGILTNQLLFESLQVCNLSDRVLGQRYKTIQKAF